MNTKKKIHRGFKYLLAMLFLFGCSQNRKLTSVVKEKITNRFDSNGYPIENLIRIDGYYQYQSVYVAREKDNLKIYDSILINILFFKDGTYAENFFFKKDLNKSEISQNLEKAIYKKKDQKIHVNYWGIYRIIKDTIIVQSLFRAGPNSMWNLSETSYKVLDRTTLKIIKQIPLLKGEIVEYDISKDSYLKFNQADSLPSSNNWLKDQKRFWKNSADYELYNKKVEEKRIE